MDVRNSSNVHLVAHISPTPLRKVTHLSHRYTFRWGSERNHEIWCKTKCIVSGLNQVQKLLKMWCLDVTTSTSLMLKKTYPESFYGTYYIKHKNDLQGTKQVTMHG
jgi:hypothetical protein